MPVKTLIRLWPGAFMVIVGMFAAAITYHFFLGPDFVPIMVIEENHLVSSVMHPGESLEVRFTTSRFMLCHSITQRVIVSDETGLKVVNAEILEASYIQKMGQHQKGAVNVKLPADIPPGDYTYQAITYNSNCLPQGRSGVTIAKSLPFTVVAP